jgi:Fic family protein
MVYSSIQALRKILGRYGHWIQATNNGYAFDESVEIRTSSRPSPRAEKRREVKREMVLTRRQAKIHEIVSKAGYVNVTDIMRSAKVSKATAVRALSEMTQMKLLKRLGRARATHYCLENSEKT